MAPESDTVEAPGCAVTLPPVQVVLVLAGLATARLGGRLSVSATPVRATLALLVTVTTSSVGWPTRTGDVPNVTFPCAALHDSATGRVAVYYGCADTVTGLAFGYIPEIIEFTKKHSIL